MIGIVNDEELDCTLLCDWIRKV